MKIQSTAQIDSLKIGSESIAVEDEHTIDIEFSAIDSGGGFKDPILDFSFSVSKAVLSDIETGRKVLIQLTLKDPQNEENTAQFEHEVFLQGQESVEINGRLKEDNLSRTLIGFVLQLLR